MHHFMYDFISSFHHSLRIYLIFSFTKFCISSEITYNLLNFTWKQLAREILAVTSLLLHNFTKSIKMNFFIYIIRLVKKETTLEFSTFVILLFSFMPFSFYKTFRYEESCFHFVWIRSDCRGIITLKLWDLHEEDLAGEAEGFLKK